MSVCSFICQTTSPSSNPTQSNQQQTSNTNPTTSSSASSSLNTTQSQTNQNLCSPLNDKPPPILTLVHSNSLTNLNSTPTSNTTNNKQVLMLGTNRSNTTTQYVVKKSPTNHQTILILSKPNQHHHNNHNTKNDTNSKNLLNNTNHHQQHNHTKPHKSPGSNLISSYFNNTANTVKQQANSTSNLIQQNTTNSTQFNLPIPITLIPIGKIATNPTQTQTNSQTVTTNNNNNNYSAQSVLCEQLSKQEQLIPIETIEISTATIEINSTDCVTNNRAELDDQPKSIDSNTPTTTNTSINNIQDNDEIDSNKDEESSESDNKSVNDEIDRLDDENEKIKLKKSSIIFSASNINKSNSGTCLSDVTRCICKMDHDDGFMICCDKCLVWQHIACMEVNRKKIPDKFYCEKCMPRQVNAQKARQIQEKYLKNLQKNSTKQQQQQQNQSNQSQMQSRRNSTCSIKREDENESITELNSIKQENEQSNIHLDTHFTTNKTVITNDDNSCNKASITNSPQSLNEQDNQSTQNNINNSTPKQNNNKQTKRRYKTRTIREEFENKLKSSSTDISTHLNNINNSNSTQTSCNQTQNDKIVILNENLLNKENLTHQQNNQHQSAKLNNKQSKILNEFSSEIQQLINQIKFDNQKCDQIADCLKLVKLANKSKNKLALLDENEAKQVNENDTSIQYRVKASQNIKQNQLIGEYIGKVYVYDDSIELDQLNQFSLLKLELIDLKPTSSTYSSSSSSNTPIEIFAHKTILINSTQIGNNTRHIRKSCKPNTKLIPQLDSNDCLKFMIKSTENISKLDEITLPFNTFDNLNDKFIDLQLQNSICVCDEQDCKIRSKLNLKQEKLNNNNKQKHKKETRISKIKRENSNDSCKSEKSIIKDIKKENELVINIEPTVIGSKRRNSNHSPMERKKIDEPQENNNNNATTTINNKSLSREDRKLISYVRVIEKLEKQGKRKKELKQQKEAAAAAAAKTQLTNSNNDNNENLNDNINQTSQDLKENETNLKQKKKEKITLLTQTPTETLQSNQIDPEIVSINENHSETSNQQSNVKSPDYSFVDVTIQPRKTLNLLQRNLSSTVSTSSSNTALCNIQSNQQTTGTLESLENNVNFLNNQTESTQINLNNNNNGNNTNNKSEFFNPKKHWLKTCSEVVEENMISLNSISSMSSPISQPPKKRRHMFEDQLSNSNLSDLASSHNDSFESNSTFNKDELTINLPMIQSQLLAHSFMPTNISSPNIALNQFSHHTQANNQNLLNFLTIDPIIQHLTLSLYHQSSPASKQFNYIHNNNLLNHSPVSLNLLNESTQSSSDLNLSLNEKRKKVSLAEYRQRKTETSLTTTPTKSSTLFNLTSNDSSSSLDTIETLKQSNEQLYESISTNKSFTNNNEDSLCELEVYPTSINNNNNNNNKPDMTTQYQNISSSSSSSLEEISIGKSKLNKLLSEIMSNNQNMTNSGIVDKLSSNPAFETKFTNESTHQDKESNISRQSSISRSCSSSSSCSSKCSRSHSNLSMISSSSSVSNSHNTNKINRASSRSSSRSSTKQTTKLNNKEQVEQTVTKERSSRLSTYLDEKNKIISSNDRKRSNSSYESNEIINQEPVNKKIKLKTDDDYYETNNNKNSKNDDYMINRLTTNNSTYNKSYNKNYYNNNNYRNRSYNMDLNNKYSKSYYSNHHSTSKSFNSYRQNEDDINMRRKKLDEMLDEYRNKGMKSKMNDKCDDRRRSRTRSCSLNRSPSVGSFRSESGTWSSDEDNINRNRKLDFESKPARYSNESNRYYTSNRNGFKRSNSLNRDECSESKDFNRYESVKASRSSEDQHYIRNYSSQKIKNYNNSYSQPQQSSRNRFNLSKFDLRYQLNKNYHNKSVPSTSSSASSSSSSSSTEISCTSSSSLSSKQQNAQQQLFEDKKLLKQ